VASTRRGWLLVAGSEPSPSGRLEFTKDIGSGLLVILQVY